jgi:chloramphenicol 3-O phosphotransferase
MKLGEMDHAGELGHQLFSGMHHAIAALSRCGNNVIADHVMVEPSWVAECAMLFADLPAYLVGVHCPLEGLEAREISRGDRTLGQARKHFDLVHAHGVYDLEVDMSVLSVDECVASVMKMVETTRPYAFKMSAKKS